MAARLRLGLRPGRLLTTTPHTTTALLQGEALETARPYEDVPRASFWQLTWNMIKNPEQQLKLDRVFKEHFDRLGPIFKLSVPLKGDLVCTQCTTISREE